ncbi:MAG: hypothetical protein U1F36_14655 [Planctomycetota bacterium]
MKTLTSIPMVLLAAVAAAQGPTFTSPPNMIGVEGNSDDSRWLGTSQDVQQSSQHVVIDATGIGTPRHGIRAAWWRRDGSQPNDPNAVSRVTTIGMRMAHGDYGQVVRGDFADVNTVLTSGWTTVYTPKPTSLPDWRNTPSGVANFDLRLPFDVPFDYDGNDALVFNWMGYGSTAPEGATHPVDKQEDSAFYVWVGPDNGTGCDPTGNGSMRLQGQWWVFAEQDTSLRCYVDNAPFNQPVIMNFGFSDPSFSLPGLCTGIHSSGEISVPMGLSDPGGHAEFRLNFPHDPSYVGGLDLHLQAWALDPNAPIWGLAGSNGNQLAQYPAPPIPGIRMATSSVGVWTSGTTDFTDFVFWSGYGAIVTGFEN